MIAKISLQSPSYGVSKNMIGARLMMSHATSRGHQFTSTIVVLKLSTTKVG
jgi:hypothetical protein